MVILLGYYLFPILNRIRYRKRAYFQFFDTEVDESISLPRSSKNQFYSPIIKGFLNNIYKKFIGKNSWTPTFECTLLKKAPCTWSFISPASPFDTSKPHTQNAKITKTKPWMQSLARSEVSKKIKYFYRTEQRWN